MAAEIRLAGREDQHLPMQLLSAQLGEHGIDIGAVRLGQAIDAALADARLGMFLLARCDGEDVGVAYISFQWSLEHGGKAAWLEELYVIPSQRAGGIGVEPEHERAEHLYERAGFRAHRRRRWVRSLSDD